MDFKSAPPKKLTSTPAGPKFNHGLKPSPAPIYQEPVFPKPPSPTSLLAPNEIRKWAIVIKLDALYSNKPSVKAAEASRAAQDNQFLPGDGDLTE